MIALAIFGMLAAAGVALLAFSVRAQAAGEAKLGEIGAVERLSSLLTADLAEAVDRPARDEQGTRLPAFVGTANAASTPLLRLVRGGWSNLDGAPRSGLQKVEYRFAAGALQRMTYPMVDGAAPLPPTPILTGLKTATVRYRLSGAWSDRWDGTQGAPFPQALELTLIRQDGRSVRELFLVGTGAPPRPQPTPTPTSTPNAP